jgi:peptidoglycan hydrolase CwlO-like protein
MDYETASKELGVVKRQVRDLQSQLDMVQADTQEQETALKRENDELRAELTEMNEIIKIKERMLDD